MSDLTPVFTLIAIFSGISLIVHVVLSHKLKMKILDSGNLELDPEVIKAIYGSSRNKLATLKWGLISLFSGIGLITTHFCQFEMSSTLPWGILMSFVALGFLIYFFIAKMLESK